MIRLSLKIQKMVKNIPTKKLKMPIKETAV